MTHEEMVDKALKYVLMYEWDANAWMYLYFMITRDHELKTVHGRLWYRMLMDELTS